MNCSVKFLVPIVIAGASDGAPPFFLLESELPPQPANATTRTAMAAVNRRNLISGYGCLVTGRRPLRDLGGHRDLEPEGTPLTRPAIRPDPAAVVLDDSLAHRQADPRTRVVTAAVEAVERLEDLARVLGVHPDAVVGHGEAHEPVVARRADGDSRLALRELDRVADEVLENLAEIGRGGRGVLGGPPPAHPPRG